MKIVITGAFGHIGSKIIRDFANNFNEAKIILIDNLMTQRYASLFNLPKNGNYQFFEKNINEFDLESILEPNDIVIHLAAITDAAGSVNKADELEENNYNTTFKVANACLEAGASLISLSSTSVYGTQKLIVSEDCSEDELKPQSPYAITKLKEEKLVTDLIKKGLKAIILRFGTIYGISQGMRFHTAVNKFCWQASMGQSITVWETAYDQKRPYLDLNDASRAFKHIIDNNIFDGRIYNVLTDNLTVRNIVDIIKEEIPSLKIKFVNNAIMNQLSYEVSCERFLKTNFIFEGNIRNGIKRTISLIKPPIQ
ncbi:SDR family oxidoreductase [Flavobacteriaceae bacterium]|nr:SDR family oxidoreductase [Flavobacteriaceae bacterium]